MTPTSTETPVVPADVSPLDEPPQRFARRPFYDETVTLLRSVRDHDYDTLAALCDDDFGIVDVDPNGNAVPVRNRLEWERWFHELFGTLQTMGAKTDSEILDYHAVASDELGYSVLEFRQFLRVHDIVATFDCIATVVWKWTPAGWREARWHGSVVSSDVPPELHAVAG
jgi:hypothetical protein